MHRYFHDLLRRATRIRELIEEELRRPAPSAVRLFRLKAIGEKLKNRLDTINAKRLLAIQSAPRFKPSLIAIERR